MKKILFILLLLTTQFTYGQQNEVKTYTVDYSKMQYFSRQVLDRIALQVIDAVLVDETINPFRNDSLVSHFSEKDLMNRMKNFSGIEYHDSITPFSIDTLRQKIQGVWFSFNIDNNVEGSSINLNSIGVTSQRSIVGIQLPEEPIFHISKRQLKQILTKQDYEWLNYFAINNAFAYGSIKYNHDYYHPYKSYIIDVFWDHFLMEVNDTATFVYSGDRFLVIRHQIQELIEQHLELSVFQDSMAKIPIADRKNPKELLTNFEVVKIMNPLYPDDTTKFIERTIIHEGVIGYIKFVEVKGELFSIGFASSSGAKQNKYLWVKQADLKKYLTAEQYNFLLMLYQELKRNNNEPFKPLLDVEY